MPISSNRAIILKPYDIAVLGQKHSNTFSHPGRLSYRPKVKKNGADVAYQIIVEPVIADLDRVKNAQMTKPNVIKHME